MDCCIDDGLIVKVFFLLKLVRKEKIRAAQLETSVGCCTRWWTNSKRLFRERSGSVVECLTRDRGATGSSLTGITALWSLSKTHLS